MSNSKSHFDLENFEKDAHFIAHKYQVDRLEDHFEDSVSSQTGNDDEQSEIIMNETLSFIKDNIMKSQNPSDDVILEYINKLMMKEITGTPVKHKQAYSEKLQHLREKRRMKGESFDGDQVVPKEITESLKGFRGYDLENNEGNAVISNGSVRDSKDARFTNQGTNAVVVEKPTLTKPLIMDTTPPKKAASPESKSRATSNVDSKDQPILREQSAPSLRQALNTGESQTQKRVSSSPKKNIPSKSITPKSPKPKKLQKTPKQSTPKNNREKFFASPRAYDSPTASGIQQSSKTILRTVLKNGSTRETQPTSQPIIPSYPSSIADDFDEDVHIPKPPTNKPEERIVYYLNYLANKSQIIRFDAIKNLNEIYHDASVELINSLYTSTTVEEIVMALENYRDQEDSFNLLAIETLGLIGNQASSSLPVLISILQNPSCFILFEAVLNTCLQIGENGLQQLINISENANSELDSFILTHIGNHPTIQEYIIVPSLLRECQNSNETSRKLDAVRAIAQLGPRARSTLTALLPLLMQGTVNRTEVANTIRALGDEGEQMLTFFLTQNQNPRIRACAARSFGTRISENLNLTVIVHADFTTAFSSAPRIQFVEKNGHSFLFFDARELITTINRQIKEGVYQDLYKRRYDVDSTITESLLNVLDSFQQKKKTSSSADKMSLLATQHHDEVDNSLLLLRSSHTQEELPLRPIQNAALNNRIMIPRNATIVALGNSLLDSDENVKSAAAYALGEIGMPAVNIVLKNIVHAINDPSNRVRGDVIECLGKLSQGFLAQNAPSPVPRISMMEKLIPMLKDSFYNVRFQTVLTIRQFGYQFQVNPDLTKKVISALFKILLDGSVNRQETAETLISIGPQGAAVLIRILKQETSYNSKVRVSAASGLSFADIKGPNIDEVVEILLQSASRDKIPLVRRSIIRTLGLLAERAKESLTYLRSQSLLPFMYNFLKDSEASVREMAAEVLASSGPRGELLLVEGVLKDSNPIVRAGAGYGLYHVGPKCIRTLLLALNDKDPQVCRAVAVAIESLGVSSLYQSLRNRPVAVQKAVVKDIEDVLLIINLVPSSQSLSKTLLKLKAKLQKLVK